MMSIRMFLRLCIEQDATVTQFVDGAAKLGYTPSEIAAALKEWLEEKDS